MCPSQSGVLGVVLCSMLVLAGGLTVVRSAASDDFRVENEVFFGSGKNADLRSTTIFHDGTVYDYLEDPPEVIVFDRQGGRFVLLDTLRRVRAELTTEEVLAFTQQLQRRAAAHQDPVIKFLADPRFDQRFDRASGELTLSSPWITYRLVLVDAQSRATSEQYREFCDWYARLNTLLNPGSKPPFGRLAVNAAVANREATAREVRLTLTPPKGSPTKRSTVRSLHRLVRPLAEADLGRVTQTRQFMNIFQPVDFQQYRRNGQP